MNLEPDDDQLLLRDATRSLLADQLGSGSLRAFVDGGGGAPAAAWWRLGAQMGWTNLLLPEPWGAGARIADLAIVCEELGRAMFPGPLIASTVAGLILSAAVVDNENSELASVLTSVADGSTVVGWCPLPAFAESATWTGTDAMLSESGGGLRLTGSARFVQDADVAAHFLVAAWDTFGVSHALVTAGDDSVVIRPHIGLDLTRRLFEVRFENTAVGLVGARGAAHPLAARMNQLAAVMLAADSVGGSAELLERTVRYAGERIAFGRPIAAYQAVKHKCADMLVQTESARVATYFAALALDELAPAEAARAVSVAKSYAGEAFSRITGESLQIHGGIGFAWEHDCHLFMRRARADEVLFGGPSRHREALAPARP
jgi:alkylation response protein AidB-like acyl-CoA dehydrogenase